MLLIISLVYVQLKMDEAEAAATVAEGAGDAPTESGLAEGDQADR